MPHHPPSLRLPQGVWRAGQARLESIAAVPTGFPSLDALLPGGGWPLGMLTELLCQGTGIGEMRILIPLLQTLTQQNRPIFLCAPPYIPYAPGFLACDIRLEPIVVIRPKRHTDQLWALEQTLRSTHFGAVLAWLPSPTRQTDLRRLQLAAHHAQGPVLLFREADAQHQPSPAPLRVCLRSCGSQQLAIHIFKRRGPTLDTALHLDLSALYPVAYSDLAVPPAKLRGALQASMQRA